MLALTLLWERDHREDGIAAKERKERKKEDQEKLTQSRLRPISPFSYVGQGRKGGSAIYGHNHALAVECPFCLGNCQATGEWLLGRKFSLGRRVQAVARKTVAEPTFLIDVEYSIESIEL
jgi:hypothetical protein